MLACIAKNMGKVQADMRPCIPGGYTYQQRLAPTLLYNIYLCDNSSFDTSLSDLPMASRGALTPAPLGFDLPFGLLGIFCDIQIDGFFGLTAAPWQCQKLPQLRNMGRHITLFFCPSILSLVFLWLSMLGVSPVSTYMEKVRSWKTSTVYLSLFNFSSTIGSTEVVGCSVLHPAGYDPWVETIGEIVEFTPLQCLVARYCRHT